MVHSDSSRLNPPVYCSGESGGEQQKGQGEVGLADRFRVSRAEVRSAELISDRLLKVTLELCGQARAVTFAVVYAETDAQVLSKQEVADGRERSHGTERIGCWEWKTFMPAAEINAQH